MSAGLKMAEPLISIIIPVYNPGKYFSSCIDSITSQNFKDWEMILVDDGSTDGSGNACDEYAAGYDNISVIHQKNAGAAAARNTGINKAKGEYIMFVDSDDMLTAGALDVIEYEISKSGAEVVFFDLLKLFSDGETASMGDEVEKEGLFGKSPNDAYNYLASRPKFPDSPCAKVFLRSFIMDNGLFFEPGLLYEDVDWMTSVLANARSFSADLRPVYLYRVGAENSASKSKDPKCAWDTLKIIKRWVGFCRVREEYPPKERMILSFMAYEFPILVSLYSTVEPERKEEMKKALKELAWLQKYRNTLKSRLSKLSYDVFGLECTCWLMNAYLRLRKS